MKSYQQLVKESEKNRRVKFLRGFNECSLEQIVKYYYLPCANFGSLRSLIKSIRDSELTYQQIWQPLLR